MDQHRTAEDEVEGAKLRASLGRWTGSRARPSIRGSRGPGGNLRRAVAWETSSVAAAADSRGPARRRCQGRPPRLLVAPSRRPRSRPTCLRRVRASRPSGQEGRSDSSGGEGRTSPASRSREQARRCDTSRSPWRVRANPFCKPICWLGLCAPETASHGGKEAIPASLHPPTERGGPAEPARA